MAGQQLTNQLSALLVNRIPAWHQIDLVGYLTGPPLAGTDFGIEAGDAPRTRVVASTKLVHDRRTGFIYLGPGGADTTATYTIDINAAGPAVHDAAAAGDASASDILNGIKAAIDGVAPPSFSVTAILDSEGRTTHLQMESTGSGDTSAPSTFVVTAFNSSGSGDMQVYAETTTFDFDVWATWARGRSDGPPQSEHWIRIAAFDAVNFYGLGGGAAFSLVGAQAFLTLDAQLDTAAVNRLAVSVRAFTLPGGDAAGTRPAFYIHLGPSTDETVDLSAQSGGTS